MISPALADPDTCSGPAFDCSGRSGTLAMVAAVSRAGTSSPSAEPAVVNRDPGKAIAWD
jgi:hypothetical protein